MRIVIVEDNKLVLHVLTAAFDAVGTYELSDFGTATAGIDACRSGADLAIFDHRLPDMKGVDAIRLLRSEEATQHLPIIMITADDDPATRMDAIKAGATDFLKKPVNIEELRLRVRNLLALREAQKSAAEREKLLNTVIAASGKSLAVIETASHGDKFIFVSDGFLASTGCKSDDVIGEGVERLRHIFPHAQSFAELEKAIQDRAVGRIVLALFTQDSSEAWVEVSLRPVPQPGGDATYLVVSLEDISDLISAREASRGLIDRMADIARISSAWFFEIDTQARVTYMSDTMARGLRTMPEEIIGLPLDLLPLSFNDPNKKRRALSTLFAEPHTAVENEELTLRSLDGTVRCIQVSIVPFTDPQGVFAGFRGSASDVSAIATARDAAARASRAKSAFLATMSHEMQTPLTAIVGMADIMNANPRTPEDAQHLRLILDAAHGLSKVLGNVLDVAALDNNSVVLHEINFDPAVLWDDLAEIYQTQAIKKGVTFHVELRGTRGQLRHGDQDRVAQIFQELLSNAVKFTETGTVHAALCIEHPDRLSMTVSDTGIGMATSEIETALKPFVQLDDNIARSFEGSGMGLNIAHGLTSAMGGQLEIHSTKGAGTVAKVSLPLPSVAARMAPSIPVDLSNKRVLVADDNAANRKILQLMLHKLGASVTMCEDGDIAIGKWDAEAFDLLLLDINMPRVAGTDVIRQIRHMEHVDGRERTPAIAVTANAAAEQVGEYFKVGFDHCIAKPFTMKTISVALSDIFADHQSCARRVKEDSPAALSGECHGRTIISS